MEALRQITQSAVRIDAQIDDNESSWSSWISEVEVLLGHNAAGDMSHDGQSLDSFQRMRKAGWTPKAAVEAVWTGRPLR
ncbi:hypothetical protein DE4585_02681 [Mycobacteroides salmoniphilum]|uniref:Uncharacterized protein n=1 Tax=Mycobacteroides salmoniphilum TaxID=404941 RepID=A0A4R8S2M8_9MYCO|nr:hypothetical protein DE4585_02681 [Mycobacteroides salmoniphilum]